MKPIVLPGLVDSGLEIFPHNGQALAVYRGITSLFRYLPEFILNRFRSDMSSNPHVKEAFQQWKISDPVAQLEKYVSCRFSGVDFDPDMDEEGNLNPDFSLCPLRGTCAFEGKVCVHLEGVNGVISGREFQVLMEIMRGKPEKQICATLDICQVTVAKHRKSLFGKTETSSSVELVMWATTKLRFLSL